MSALSKNQMKTLGYEGPSFNGSSSGDILIFERKFGDYLRAQELGEFLEQTEERSLLTLALRNKRVLISPEEPDEDASELKKSKYMKNLQKYMQMENQLQTIRNRHTKALAYLKLALPTHFRDLIEKTEVRVKRHGNYVYNPEHEEIEVEID